MGFFKTLLKGGGILGRFCQMISESVSLRTLTCADGTEYIVRAAVTEINGVRFSQVIQGDKTMLQALNTDFDMYACVTYPNGYGKTKGFQVFIPPASTADLDLGEWDIIPPDLPIYVQKIDLREGADMTVNRVNIAFRNLELGGGTLDMPNTKITADMNGIKISFATAGLGDLQSAELKSENGINAAILDPVQFVEEGPTETSYKISFADLGYSEGDTLSGTMQFGINKQSAELIKRAADKAAAESGYNELSKLMCEAYNITAK